MPNFRTVQQAHDYCAAHFPSTPTPTLTHWSPSTMDFYTEAKLVMLVGFGTCCYFLGKDGWTGLKAVYAWLRNKFSDTQTTPTPTAVPPTTPVA